MKAFRAAMGGTLALYLTASVATAKESAKAPAADWKAAKPTSAATQPAEKHLLRYKFAAGEVLRYDVVQRTRERVTMKQVTQDLEVRNQSLKAWKVTDVLPSGEMEFVHLVEWVKMSNQSAGQKANVYDSRKDAKPPRGFEQAAAAVGTPLLVMHISPTGEIVSREEKHAQPPAREDMPITLQLPQEAIGVGETWDKTYDLVVARRSGAKQEVRTRRRCRLSEVKGGIASIEVTYDILTPVDPYVRAQFVDRLGKGVVRFDIERGRIVSQAHEVDRRIVGFNDDASSLHYTSHMKESLVAGTHEQPGDVKLTSSKAE